MVRPYKRGGNSGFQEASVSVGGLIFYCHIKGTRKENIINWGCLGWEIPSVRPWDVVVCVREIYEEWARHSFPAAVREQAQRGSTCVRAGLSEIHEPVKPARLDRFSYLSPELEDSASPASQLGSSSSLPESGV